VKLAMAARTRTDATRVANAGRGSRAHRLRPAPVLLALAACLGALPGCYTPQLLRLQGGLDSLRAVVDTLTVRDGVALTVLADTRRELADQRELLLSTRATSGSSSKEVTDQMARLDARLDELTKRFAQTSARSAPTTTTGVDPGQLYDQASQDLTQGRYAMALSGFREYLARYPASDLSDNARYGAGESFFAQSRFDSAAVEYQRVVSDYPNGDKVPAALYKLALSEDKLGQSAASRKTFEDLIKRYPDSGEAQLARDRVGGARKR
jgi:tol-pal system protein YbgF